MKYTTQDTKFCIESDTGTPRLVGQDGPVPDDEPLFILRGRDSLAVETLLEYYELAHDRGSALPHLKAITDAVDRFHKFAKDHPERMKIPDTDLNKRTEGKPGIPVQ